MRFALAFAVATVIASCRPGVPVATPADAARGNVALAELEQGRGLMIRKCTGCHKTPMPTDHTAHEWPTMLDEMSERSKLSSDERRLIEQYFVVMANR
ncbi:MAG: hypothetical protein AB7O24_29790 [Kofleriaceae bacterium]